ncbi:MAG TPA: alpha-ketoglutarate-dependent dioxygenase AlkB [Candidatus Obscuribacterales bacterium]
MAKKKIVYVQEPPEGLFYIPSFLSAQEEKALLDCIATEPFQPYDHHGYLAKREIVFYGSNGGYNGRDEDAATPMPDWMKALSARCAHLIGLANDELEMGLVAHYPVGAGIGWHRDAPQFGPTVIGVSFASDAVMRFRRFVDAEEEMFRINLQHGSAYIISGSARSIWQHGMLPVKELRYSITFRTIKKNAPTNDPRHDPVNIAKRLAALEINVRTEWPVAQPTRATGRQSALKQLSLFENGQK